MAKKKEATERRSFDPDFKLAAAKMAVAKQKERGAMSYIAKELGIEPVLLSNWVKKYKEKGEDAFKGGAGSTFTPDDKLQKELDALKKKM